MSDARKFIAFIGANGRIAPIDFSEFKNREEWEALFLLLHDEPFPDFGIQPEEAGIYEIGVNFDSGFDGCEDHEFSFQYGQIKPITLYSEITQLEKENSELKCRLDEIKLYIPKIGETLKLTEKDKLIAELKEELAKECKVANRLIDSDNAKSSSTRVYCYSDSLCLARQRIKERKGFK